jgi:hypothetical protein
MSLVTGAAKAVAAVGCLNGGGEGCSRRRGGVEEKISAKILLRQCNLSATHGSASATRQARRKAAEMKRQRERAAQRYSANEGKS